MHSSRTFLRSPQVCRLVQVPAATRSMSLLSPFGPKFQSANTPIFGNDFAPLLRLLDDLASPRIFDHFSPPQPRPTVVFQPRFDVREVDGAYELRGEVPGVESRDLEVQFTDATTLIIRGHTASETTSGSSSKAAAIDNSPQTTTLEATGEASDAASTHSASSYQKPTVEDENGVEQSSTPGQATPAASTISEQPQTSGTAAASAEGPQATDTITPSAHYWVTERKTGSFQRSFTFPGRIDQDGVRASLKNGVLNIMVPKAVARSTRRIVVE